ncbi:hypothetical protein GCM10020358_50760 [Amorphoplanes nipponensis]|uniref:Uncharacterized protein n=1 Tax=Actinoplanes nipponensis TaxID=135950 RepID=A0A919MMH5_9ACTN|nr:hypothetical protein [Actinoplanes nipponensis]GIE47418.1 hypothetical protein Ani05nite_09520 [Actinoplanes nipponensis]
MGRLAAFLSGVVASAPAAGEPEGAGTPAAAETAAAAPPRSAPSPEQTGDVSMGALRPAPVPRVA